MERIINPKKNNLKVVSLFSGIGGFDLAFMNAGYDIVFANDIDKYCKQTYEANIGDNFVLGDINELIDTLPDMDILVGGFPCQPFSLAGDLKGFDDPEKGNLFFTIRDIAKKYRPKAMVLENVKNLMNHDKGRTYKRIKQELEDIGYVVNSQVLNTQDFGIPQNRTRIVIVAFDKEQFSETPDFEYPKPKHLTISVKDLLDKEVSEKYFITNKSYEYIMSEGTKGFKAAPSIDTQIAKTLLASMHKCHRASIDNYITDIENYNKNCDKAKYTTLRKLTPNECRQLQGFPSDWKQVVSNTQAYKQFGNAVTVDVFYYVAIELHKYLQKYCKTLPTI